MASYLDKAQVNTAITNNSKLDLGHQHITTGDFFQLNPSYIHEMVPGSKIDIKMESFARLNPLPVPTFGRASMRTRAFFVPFRTIFRGWNDFITDSVHIFSDGQTSSAIQSFVPRVSNLVLMNTFASSVATGANASESVTAMIYQVSGAVYDIAISGTTYNFTVLGRQAIKILESLGYKINWDSKDDTNYSALPLLALAKVYADWYYPAQYHDLNGYDYLMHLCNYDMQTDLQLSASDVKVILQNCAWTQYDSDYFVSAWDTPNQPNTGNYSDFKLVNIDSVGEIIGGTFSSPVTYTIDGMNGVSNNSSNASNNGDVIDRYGLMNAPFITPTVRTTAGGTLPAPISQYLLHGLHALTDYMKRHQLAGSRAMDRYLARFGKALSAEKLNRSMYLGSNMQDIQIGDVMSTSDTVNGSDGAQLGAYAGKGISYGTGHFDFNTDEFGYLLVLTSIVPATGYYQGIDRQVMRTSKLQFFTPEFDSLGTQPITADELFIPGQAGLMTGDSHSQIFGFTPRYADYKVARDYLTGNFRLNSVNGGAEYLMGTNNAAGSWHTMRVFKAGSDFNGDWTNVVHNPSFISGKSDFAQYKRIFYNDDADAPDNFTIIHNFEIAEYAPMKALYDSYEFEDKGKKVTLETNGVKMN